MVNTRNSEQVGARRVAKRRGGALWGVLAAVIVLLLAAVAAWFLFLDDDTDVDLGSANSPATNDTSPATSSPGRENSGVVAGEIFAGGRRVLPGGESQLSRFVNQPAEGRTVRVLSVPADEGFWVGTGTTNRVFVHLALAPSESPFNVQQGETVSFTGTVKAVPADPESRFGLTASEGLDDLRRQGAYIEATNVRGVDG